MKAQSIVKSIWVLILLLGLIIPTKISISQNIGVGTTAPTNFFHVSPPIGTIDPLRVELVRLYTNEQNVLVIGANGVVKYMPINDVLQNMDPSLLDSIILNSVLSQTDTIFNNPEVRDSILSIISSKIDSLLINSSAFDSLYIFISDSLLKDTSWLSTLADSLGPDSDDQNLDSMTLYSTIITTYIENGSPASIDLLPLASDSAFYTTIRDSLIGDTLFLDSIYNFISDSLLKDTSWLSTLADSLGSNSDDQNLDSMTLYSTIITTYIENGSPASTNLLPLASDSAFYTTIRDSLLGDSTFISSIDSILRSDSSFINAIIDSLLSNFYFKDSLFTYIRDSLIKDNKFTDSLFTIIRDSLIFDNSFFDSIYKQISDSLLNDTGWLSKIQDSIDTDYQNLFIGTGTATTSIIGIERGDSIVIQAGANITLTESGDTITIAGSGGSGGLTAIIAGDGLTGTNLAGPIPTLHALATNGLYVDALADSIKLGGSLVEHTIITQSSYDMVYDLTDTGVFEVRDSGNTAFIVTDSGNVGISTSNPQSLLHVSGSFGAKVKNINNTNSPYLAANETYILANASAGAITVDLPSAPTVIDRVYHIKKTDNTNTVTINANGAETIDGVSTQILSNQYEQITIVSDGVAWYIMGQSNKGGSGGVTCYTCDGF